MATLAQLKAQHRRKVGDPATLPASCHAVTVYISPELLERALGLPTGVKITGARWDSISHILTLRVDHPSFASVPEGSEPMPATLEEVTS